MCEPHFVSALSVFTDKLLKLASAAKWREALGLDTKTFDVSHYGAVGDGTTDDTAAVRAAAAAFLAYTKTVNGNTIVPAKLLFRPGGVYKITGSINLQSLGQSGNGGAWEI